MSDFPRITIQPEQMGGVPCIRGLRIPVSVVVNMVASGMSTAEIVRVMPDLEADDVTEALRYAAKLATKPVSTTPDRLAALLDKARRNAGLNDEEARKLGVEETRAHRRERVRGNG